MRNIDVEEDDNVAASDLRILVNAIIKDFPDQKISTVKRGPHRFGYIENLEKVS